MEPEVPKVGSILQNNSNDMPEEIDNQEFEVLFQNLQNTDDAVRLDAVTKIKHMLYANPNLELETTINRLINKGILDVLVQIVKTADNFELKYQTIWAFVNICCGNSTQIGKVVEVGVVDISMYLIEQAANGDPNDQNAFNLALESVWLLGNIAGDGLEHRDACLELDAAHKIIKLVEKFPHDEKLLDNTIWTLQNLVAKKPSPFWNQISETLPLFQSVLKDFKTADLQYHALWGICYISASYVLDVIQSGVVPTLIAYLGCDKHKLIFPALQALGNLISTTRDTTTDEVLKHPDFLKHLFNLCSSTNERIRIYATWAVSNITAGTPQQITKILENPDYLNSLSTQLHDPEEKIKYQASCAWANLMFRATIDQIEVLVTKHSYLEGLLEVMKQDHPRTYERNFMEPINRIATADTTRKFQPIFQNKGLIEQMRSISDGLSYEMRTMYNETINKYFSNPPAPTLPADKSAAPNLQLPSTTVSTGAPVTTAPVVAVAAANPSPRETKNKASKPETRKKIFKVEKSDPIKKKMIKRTKTMMHTIEEAKKMLGGMKGGRTRKSSKPAAASGKPAKQAKKKEDKGSATKGNKLRRTNTMKQTLNEAKKILKQIDAAKKSKK